MKRTFLMVAALVVPSVRTTPALAWQTVIGIGSFYQDIVGLQIDPAGDVVAVGKNSPAFHFHFLVTKLARDDGTVRWATSIPTGDTDRARAVVIEPAGDVVAVGSTGDVGSGPPSGQFTVVRLSGATGAEIWRRVVPSPGGSGAATAVALDGAGQVLAAGWMYDAASGSDMVAVKLDQATGAVLWQHSIAGTAQGTTDRTALAVDAAGNVLVAGTTANSASGNDFAVAKLSAADGSEMWRVEVDGSAGGSDAAYAVAVDGSGDVVAAGTLENTRTAADLAVLKLSGATGVEQWRYVVDGSFGPPESTSAELARSLVLTPAGDVIAVGRLFVASAPSESMAVVKLAGADGAVLWSQSLAGYEGVDVALDPASDVVAVGSASNPARLGILKLAGATGDAVWFQSLRGTAAFDPTETHADRVAVDTSGHVVVQGAFVDYRGSLSEVVSALSDRLSGSMLRIVDPAGQPAMRTLKVASRDKAILLSAPGSPSDPTAVGATLTLRNPFTAETDTYALPAANWKGRASKRIGSQQYKYRDPARVAGPCKQVTLKNGTQLAASCSGTGIHYSLDEAMQGALQVRLEIGSAGFAYCMRFGGTVSADGPGVFNAMNAAPPSSCP